MQTVYWAQCLKSFRQYCLVLLLAGSGGLLKGAAPAPSAAREAARQTTCPAIDPYLSLEGGIICNAQDVAPENLKSTITLFNTQLGIFYQVWGNKGGTRSSFSARVAGNGENWYLPLPPTTRASRCLW